MDTTRKVEKYQAWTCTLVVPGDAELPNGFDFPPRDAARNAVLQAGIPVVALFTGWGGTVTEGQLAVIENRDPAPDKTDPARLARFDALAQEIATLADCQIPFYAYGDNEAACDMARRLEAIHGLVAEAPHDA